MDRVETHPALHALALSGQRGDAVCGSVMTAILQGDYAPGEKLLIEELASVHGVSITPVRDALARLESHGVLVRVPYQGYYVRRFDNQEVHELYEVRAGLETLAAGLACERITEQRLEQLETTYRAGDEALARNDLDDYQVTNEAFHAVILESAGNGRLLRTMAGIALQMQMMITHSIRVPGRTDRARSEHRILIEHLRARHVEAAECAMKAHVYAALHDLTKEPVVT